MQRAGEMRFPDRLGGDGLPVPSPAETRAPGDGRDR